MERLEKKVDEKFVKICHCVEPSLEKGLQIFVESSLPRRYIVGRRQRSSSGHEMHFHAARRGIMVGNNTSKR